jgi:hypothetical protein
MLCLQCRTPLYPLQCRTPLYPSQHQSALGLPAADLSGGCACCDRAEGLEAALRAIRVPAAPPPPPPHAHAHAHARVDARAHGVHGEDSAVARGQASRGEAQRARELRWWQPQPRHLGRAPHPHTLPAERKKERPTPVARRALRGPLQARATLPAA